MNSHASIAMGTAGLAPCGATSTQRSAQGFAAPSGRSGARSTRTHAPSRRQVPRIDRRSSSRVSSLRAEGGVYSAPAVASTPGPPEAVAVMPSRARQSEACPPRSSVIRSTARVCVAPQDCEQQPPESCSKIAV